MLDIKRIRENDQDIRQGLEKQGEDTAVVDRVLELDRKRRDILTEVETLKSERNKVSKEIGLLKKKGEDTTDVQASVRALGDRIGELDEQVRMAESDFRDALLRIPNVPHASAPVGADDSDNVLVRSWGELRSFDFEPKNHMELGESHLIEIDLNNRFHFIDTGVL